MNSEKTAPFLDNDSLLVRVAYRFWPELKLMSDQRRLAGIGNVLSFLYSLPLALIGLFWLIRVTNLDLIRQEWPVLLFSFGLIILFSRVSYFIIIEIRTDRYGSSEGSLASMIQWSTIFLFGATACWLMVLGYVIYFFIEWRKSITLAARWNLLCNLTMDLSKDTLAVWLALVLYQHLGGKFPLPGLSIEAVIPAFFALSINIFIIVLIWSGYIYYHTFVQKFLSSSNTLIPIFKFFLLSFGLPYLSNPFAILAAGLYIQNGFGLYLFFLIGLLLVAVLARQLSWLAERSRQQSRQLEKLELLGQALIDAPLDVSSLPGILEEHIPNMFPSGHITIWISPGEVLINHPSDWPAIDEGIKNWVLCQSSSQAFLTTEQLPWEGKFNDHHAIVTTPIFKRETSLPIGGIYIELRALAQPWDKRSLHNQFPALQSLAAQIASALHQSEVYHQNLDYQTLTQELRLAGQIQASFLPNKFPSIPGWQLSVTLLPARETSGDYFDVIELSKGRLGILVADVADKGIGPALYMALSRTLIRTYAVEYDAEPEVVFYAANERLLKDARANLFVTAFYGILDPARGTLTYCNAGHNPPILLRANNTSKVQSLVRTGMAMGIEEGTTWNQATITIEPGDLLILYTDGIPDAQNIQGDFYEEERLIEITKANLGLPAYEIQTAILENIQRFVGDAAQFDDITLMILIRDS